MGYRNYIHGIIIVISCFLLQEGYSKSSSSSFSRNSGSREDERDYNYSGSNDTYSDSNNATYRDWGGSTLSKSDRRLHYNGNSSGYSTGNSGSTASQEPGPLRISRYISYSEGTNSEIATRYKIPNIPSARQLVVMRYTGTNLFDLIREYFNRPLHISSFFRSRALNTKIGGASSSHHMILGNICALDIDQDNTKGPTNLQVFNYIRDHTDFHVLIWEFGTSKPNWVHVAYSLNPIENKYKRIYKASKVNNKTIYTRI